MNTIKAAGIIAEYNPFHNGHHYQVETVRRLTGADYVIAAMSGDFVQRGEPAIFDKYTRAHMALCGGADLVVELPTLFATSSAEDFAACGVALLSALGADILCFGSESGNLEVLQKAAEILTEEPAEWKELHQGYLKQGESFPAARCRAMEALTGEPEFSVLLSSPNNILAVEYLKAIHRQKSPMQPVTIRRKGAGYHDTGVSGPLASASALRELLHAEQMPAEYPVPGDGDTSLLSAQMPPAVLSVLSESGALTAPLFADDLTELLNFRLLAAIRNQDNLSRYADLAPDLAARLTKQTLQFAPFSERIARLKSRSYTYTRISRALLHLTLGITEEETRNAKALGYAPYARILGFKKSAGPLLSHLRERSQIPLITKTADAGNILSPEALSILETDFYASHVYQSLLAARGRTIRNEYTKSVIVL